MPAQKLKPRIGIACLSSPLEVGADKAARMEQKLSEVLKSIGCEVVEAGSVDSPEKAIAAGKKLAEKHVHGVAFGAVSWFEDYLVVDLLEECNVPIFLWSFPGVETGALCGSQQLTAYLKQLDYSYSCAFGDVNDEAAIKKIQSWAKATALKKLLRTSKIGIVGHRIAGMVEAAVNEIQLKKSLGPRVIYFDLAKILGISAQLSNSDVQKKWEELTKKANKCDVSEKEGVDSIKIYKALREIITQNNLNALAFGCYPDNMGCACIAASLLADENIPLACEGDVNAAVGQLILSSLTGRPTHNTDWLEPLDDGTIVLTHCGSGSLSLADSEGKITLGHVRLMKQGVCAMFPSKPGIVTMLNLLPRGEHYQIAMLKGEALHTEMVFPGNPLRVKFQAPTMAILDWIHNEGIGHHWVVGYDDISNEIRMLVSITKNNRLIELV
ncbi:MAG: hypothetical protein A2Y10_16080 [Planctomycetes bacterium GWF2_41_51]|nr:MAG: hypothetical protein A2Y10_16080 [Planctomycetes bacterium GWF2_41_51]HBG25656.1 hypothetical protein [Phycisphaerales bacterium]